MSLAVFVPGKPAPQGSKRHVGRGVMVESSKDVKPWRNDIRAACIDRDGKPLAYFDGPVAVRLEFICYRPGSIPKRKKTPAATKKPDIDKLSRAVLDAIGSAGCWRDDSQVVRLSATKRLAEIGEPMGCRIRVEEAEEIAA
jgi:crossover junction endodeoxyribonuclease RusA